MTDPGFSILFGEFCKFSYDYADSITPTDSTSMRFLDVSCLNVNSKVKDGTDASDMMTIFTEDGAYDRERFPAISERKWRFKNSEKKVAEMGYSYEEIKNEAYEERDKDKIKEMLDMESFRRIFLDITEL